MTMLLKGISFFSFKTFTYLCLDFSIPYISDVIRERMNKPHNKLEAHPNPLLQSLQQPVNTGRLKRCWPCTCQAPEVTSLN